jgi:hypothetical protein
MKKLISLLLLVSVTSILFTGCDWFKSDEQVAKENFIAANKTLACESVNNPKLAVETVESKKRVKEIFEEYDLPVEDDEAMFQLFDKYEYEEDVMAEIKDYVDNECEVVLPE